MNIKESSFFRKIAYLFRGYREKHSFIQGRLNEIHVYGTKVGSRIQIMGNGNKVIIEKRGLLKDCLIKISGNNNTVILRREAFVSGAELWVENNGCTIEIGARTFVGHHSHLACTGDGCCLSVGANGMISSYVQIRTGDSHSIVDMDGHRLNLEKSVKIGDHCWLGEGSKVLKGVTLEGDNVVSTGAIVTKSFNRNVLLGGIPAKVLKENINWKSER